jgi:pyrroline-5-carboxylate reductase
MNNLGNIGFIGGGNMAAALIQGLKNKGLNPKNIMVIEPSQDKCNALSNAFGVISSNILSDIVSQNIIILAVKPQQLKPIAESLAPHLKSQLVISIAAGIRLKDLCRWLGHYSNIIRCMPNTPAQIQAGITGLYAMQTVSEKDKSVAEVILNSAGVTLWLENEELLDAVTAISGSGPAYVFYMIEALTAAGIALGLTENQAKLLALHTFKGASLLAEESQQEVSTLRVQVTSKGGTTEQGLLSLEKSGVKSAIIQAAFAAEKRAKSLAEELGNT